MKYNNDERIVMTLDAGGTNFVFSAIKSNQEIVDPVTLPSNSDNLEKSLSTIIEGFNLIKGKTPGNPAAISFAFPGPADYPLGIIEDLPNLPAYRGGIALGPMLENIFQLPVFINNDGDLFALGEAIGGYLPYINNKLKTAGSTKRYNNLVGLTLGTGFGGGIVVNGKLLLGDNSAGGEVWLLRNKIEPRSNAEEGVSIRAIKNVFKNFSNIQTDINLNPKDIYEIGIGNKSGDMNAAKEAYRQLAIVAGDAVSNILTLIDGIAVLGGGISAAHPLFMSDFINEMNSFYIHKDGERIPRLVMKVFNLENETEFSQFITGTRKELTLPGTNKKIIYDSLKRTGVGISKIGTSKAIAIGAYAFALDMLDV